MIFLFMLVHIYMLWFRSYDAATAAASWCDYSRGDAADGGGPGLGSAGVALGGLSFRVAHLGAESGSRCRPGYSLVEVLWATVVSEGAGPAGGGSSAH
jgi:hypothetical protein